MLHCLAAAGFFTVFVCKVEITIFCGSAPGVVQTQHSLGSLRNNNEIALISSTFYYSFADDFEHFSLVLGTLHIIPSYTKNVTCEIRLKQGTFTVIAEFFRYEA